ncbi:MAG TPA: PH domain-containing protein [Micromonosporaceae bacterium]|nr:PH domain-containing protein [Micromonosporaceae bacterium]
MHEDDSGHVVPRPAVPPSDQPAGAVPTSLSWRVPGGALIGKLAATIVLALVGLLFISDRLGVVLALVAATAVGAYAVRDILAPVRLAADGDGVTVVTGFVGHQWIPWRDVERIRIDDRRRLGLRSMLLEIDTGSSLYLFSASELGAPVEDVAEALRHIRTGR